MRKGKILIADDEDKEVFQIILEEEGYEVLLADDGEKALALVESQKPDVILLDLLMPKASGEDFLKKLKQKKILGEVGIIITTGYNDFGVTRERITKDYEIDFYLDKPISNVDLIEKVEACILKQKGKL